MMRRRRGNSMKKILQCILVVLAFLAGCVHQEVFGENEKKEWIDAAIPIAENILQSMNESDYQGFTRDFSEEMKEALTLSKFIDMKGERESTLGKYISSSPVKALERGSFVAVYFSAKFEKQGNIPVEITFKKDNKTPKVWGLWFPPDIPENGDESEPESALEDFVSWLEGEPVIRLVCITAPFLSIPAAIIAIYRLLKRKKQEE